MRRRIAAATALLALTAAAACSSGSEDSAADTTLTVSNTSCSLSHALINAGTVKLHIVNRSTEELTLTLGINGTTIGSASVSASKEGDLVKELAGGTYDVSCDPISSHTKLVVSGTQLPSVDPARARAIANYRDYVTRTVAHMVPLVNTLAEAIKRGDVAAAKAAYPPSRVGWEAIEPVAEAFGTLDPRMDAREIDVATGDTWTGWHRIEKELWTKGSTAGMTPYVEQLQRDIAELQRRIPDAVITTVSIANGAKELLEEVSTSKVTGEEEAYSHIDFVDFSANIEGAYQGFLAVKGLVKDQALVTLLQHRFTDVFNALKPYKKGQDFVLYSTVTLPQRKALSDVVNGLGEPLGALAAAVA